MKKFWSRILSAIMVLCMPLALFACGSPADSIDEDNFNSVLGMYGTKVLYRPDNYDYNSGSGGSEENPNEYYGAYGWQIIQSLYKIYGIPDTEEGRPFDKYGNNDLYNNTDLHKFLYDSIRYQPNIFATTDKGTEILGANTQNAWKWSFDYEAYDGNIIPIKNAKSYLNDLIEIQTNPVFNGELLNIYDELEFEDHNTALLFTESYKSAYVGTDSQEKTEEFSQFVQALEYVVYSYALDLEPAQMTVQRQATFPFYQIDIVGYNRTDDKTAITQALEARKKTFEKIGSFVGLVDRQKTKIKNWILQNVIGDDVVNADDTYTVYTGVKEVEYQKATSYNAGTTYYSFDQGTGVYTVATGVTAENVTDYYVRLAKYEKATSYNTSTDYYSYNQSTGTYTKAQENEVNQNNVTNFYVKVNYTLYDFSTATMQENTLGRDYANTVSAIVDGVCSQVTIGYGDEGEGGIPIDDKFLASEIKEYAGDTFLIEDDANFRLPNAFNSNSPYIQPLEYQSVTLMPSYAIRINEIAIALKYDADLNGTDDGFNPDKFIDVKISINVYKKDSNTYQTIESKICRVYDGPFLVDYVASAARENDENHAPVGHTSGAFFSLCRTSDNPNPAVENVVVGQFNTNIGNGILKTDVGRDNYSGHIFVSQSPLVLVGTTNVRNYYSLVESTIGEEGIEENHSYITGKLNYTLFSGSDGCDFFEITYKVIKRNGDDTTNYKFYTGIQYIDTDAVV